MNMRWLLLSILLALLTACGPDKVEEEETPERTESESATMTEAGSSEPEAAAEEPPPGWEEIESGTIWVLSMAPHTEDGHYRLRKRASLYMLQPQMEAEDASMLGPEIFDDMVDDPDIVRQRLTLIGEVNPSGVLVLSPSAMVAGRSYEYELSLQSEHEASGTVTWQEGTGAPVIDQVQLTSYAKILADEAGAAEEAAEGVAEVAGEVAETPEEEPTEVVEGPETEEQPEEGPSLVDRPEETEEGPSLVDRPEEEGPSLVDTPEEEGPEMVETPEQPEEGPEMVETPEQPEEEGPEMVETPEQPEEGPEMVETPEQPEEEGETFERPVQPEEEGPEMVETPEQPEEEGPEMVETPEQPEEEGPEMVETPEQPEEEGPEMVETPEQPEEEGPEMVETPEQPEEGGESFERPVQPEEEGPEVVAGTRDLGPTAERPLDEPQRGSLESYESELSVITSKLPDLLDALESPPRDVERVHRLAASLEMAIANAETQLRLLEQQGEQPDVKLQDRLAQMRRDYRDFRPEVRQLRLTMFNFNGQRLLLRMRSRDRARASQAWSELKELLTEMEALGAPYAEQAADLRDEAQDVKRSQGI